MQPVELTLMTDGYCEQLECIAIRRGRFRKIRFASMFALIEHPRLGPVLFDTGYTERFFTETRKWPSILYRCVTPVKLHAQADVVCQLSKLGISANEVQHIIVSHFHADHIGGLKDFPRATFHCSRTAYETTLTYKGLNAVRHAFLPGLIPEDFARRCTFIEDAPVINLPSRCRPFDGGRDLFRDGSVVSVDLPGHAVGQIGLFLMDKKRGDCLLAADACWLSQSFRENRLPHPVVKLLADWKSFGTTLQRLHALHESNPDLWIIPTHCSEIWRQQS